MPLPQQVIDRLAKEPPKTPGWSAGLLIFGIGIFAITVLIYLGLAYGYEPYLNSQVTNVNGQIQTLSNSISPGDQTKLVAFYSEAANVQTTLANHVTFSRFLSWLETNTEANVYYTHLSFSSGNQISLSGSAASEADVNQQMAILEAAPEVKSAVITAVSLASTGNVWNFSLSLTMDPKAVLRAAQTQ